MGVTRKLNFKQARQLIEQSERNIREDIAVASVVAVKRKAPVESGFLRDSVHNKPHPAVSDGSHHAAEVEDIPDPMVSFLAVAAVYALHVELRKPFTIPAIQSLNLAPIAKKHQWE